MLYTLQVPCGIGTRKPLSRKQCRKQQVSYREMQHREHHQASTKKEERRVKGGCYLRFIPVPDLYRVSVHTFSEDQELFTNKLKRNI